MYALCYVASTFRPLIFLHGDQLYRVLMCLFPINTSAIELNHDPN